MPTQMQFTVLFLDDEANILRAMKRLFHGRRHKLVLVDDGNKALAFMKENTVHVVVSDMKMPAMKGEVFLEKVAQLHPQTHRIVLSGYADTDSLLDAVNKGRIHRFLQKPWNNEALVEAIDEGIEKFALKHENDGLQNKLSAQNKRLALLNSSLEERVELRTLQIKTAMKRADMNVVATKKVLYNILSSIPHINGAAGKKVSVLATKLAKQLGINAKDIDDIAYAGLISELGMIGLDPQIYNTPFTKMSSVQQEQYNNQGNNALLILSPATQLKNVADILVNQFEHCNGSGYPKGVKGDDIPIGAQILAAARDYYRYLNGLYDGTQYNAKVAIGKMNKFADLHYSKTLLTALAKIVLVTQTPVDSDGLLTGQLKPGMTLKDPIYNDKDILIMPQDQILDEASITKLIDLEERFSFTLTVFVK